VSRLSRLCGCKDRNGSAGAQGGCALATYLRPKTHTYLPGLALCSCSHAVPVDLAHDRHGGWVYTEHAAVAGCCGVDTRRRLCSRRLPAPSEDYPPQLSPPPHIQTTTNLTAMPRVYFPKIPLVLQKPASLAEMQGANTLVFRTTPATGKVLASARIMPKPSPPLHPFSPSAAVPKHASF
jgi:hypothetical protein